MTGGRANRFNDSCQGYPPPTPLQDLGRQEAQCGDKEAPPCSLLPRGQPLSSPGSNCLPGPTWLLESEFLLCSLPKGTSWLESQELIPLTTLSLKGFTAPARRHLKECRRCVSASGKYDLIQGIFLFWTCQGLLFCTILGHFKCGQGRQWKETRKDGKGPQQSSMSFSVQFLSHV